MTSEPSRRDSFDKAALDYDLYRPGYPTEAITDMVELSCLQADSRVLEIGCGTGKATMPLAQRGLRVDAVELGNALASVAEGNCRQWPSVKIIRGPFESLPLQRHAYDLVFSAQAFHWIDATVRLTRSSDLLRATGSLALLYNYTPPPRDPALVELSAEIGRETGGGMKTWDYRADIDGWTSELSASDRFRNLEIRRYPWVQRYSAEEYQGLFRTYSDYLTLPPAMQERVARTIARVIGEHGGSLERGYECVLYHVRRSA